MVLILLSLVVQSLQQLVKKVLKLKSRTIESSLVDTGRCFVDIGLVGGEHETPPLAKKDRSPSQRLVETNLS